MGSPFIISKNILREGGHADKYFNYLYSCCSWYYIWLPYMQARMKGESKQSGAT